MSLLTMNEQIILGAVFMLGGEAYGVAIRDKVVELSKKDIVYGTLYNSLEYLIRKGFIESRKGDPTPERGGKSKTIYTVTKTGMEALQETVRLQESLLAGLSGLNPEITK